MYTTEFYDSICESCREIDNEWLKLESIHPTDMKNDAVLTEASISKMSIEKTLDAIINAIKEAVKRFRNITRKLRQKNAEWMAEAERVDLNKKDFQNFREEIFPYWNSMPSLFEKIRIPEFRIEEAESYKDGTFMRNNFKDIVDDEGNINKNILRGVSQSSTNDGKSGKVPIEFGQVKTAYPKILGTMRTVDNLRDRVASDMIKIAKVVEQIKNQSAPINESTLMTYSMFKDEYYDVLLEALTPDDIEKEENVAKEDAENNNDKKLNMNTEDSKNASSFKAQCDAVTAWSKLCSSVTSAEMDILDEAYTECANFITKVMKK